MQLKDNGHAGRMDYVVLLTGNTFCAQWSVPPPPTDQPSAMAWVISVIREGFGNYTNVLLPTCKVYGNCCVMI